MLKIRALCREPITARLGRDVNRLSTSLGTVRGDKAHSVPLNEAALQVLEKRKGDHPTHVFTYEGESIVQVSIKAGRNALKRAGIEVFAGTICATPSPHGIGKRARRPMSYSAWEAGKPWKWLKDMPTSRRKACRLRPVGLIICCRLRIDYMKKPTGLAAGGFQEWCRREESNPRPSHYE